MSPQSKSVSSVASPYQGNLDDPADALGHKYYILPTDDNGNPLAPASNIVNFAAGWRAGVELTTGLDIQPLVI